jgi:hypothetical protein
VTLDLGRSFSSGTRVDLRAGGLSATTGITIGGKTIPSTGVAPAPNTTPVQVSGTTASVTVPAGSAAVITFS